jgi:hypothetical protein
MASRIRTFSMECPPPEASASAKTRYRNFFKAAPVGAALFEGEVLMMVAKRAAPAKKAKRAAKRATSRKRR